MIIPKRHEPDYFALSRIEKKSIDDLVTFFGNRLSRKDHSITGFNIGINNGESAGQTIFHAHIHLIPRRDGDTANPRGGVRGVIPGKRSY